MLEGAARRMRALTGFDRVTLSLSGGECRQQPEQASATLPSAANLPAIVADSAAEPVPLFPRQSDDREIEHALLRSPTAEQLEELRDAEVALGPDRSDRSRRRDSRRIPLRQSHRAPAVVRASRRGGTVRAGVRDAAARLSAVSRTFRGSGRRSSSRSGIRRRSRSRGIPRASSSASSSSWSAFRPGRARPGRRGRGR